MDDMFLSKSLWKLLNVVLAQPWQSFYARELIKKSKTSPNTIINLLKELQKKDIIHSQKIGTTISYSLNPENELTRKLLMLYHENMLNKLPKEFASYINRLRRKIEADNILSIVLFGSVSRGTFNDLSDVDILVIYKGKINAVKIKKMFEKYSRYVQIMDFTDKEFNEKYKKGNELVINIIKNGIIVHDKGNYYKYLFEPIPKPTKQYIEEILIDVDEKLKKLYELYRKRSIKEIEPLLHTPINRLSVAVLLLDNKIPESKKDIAKKLDVLDEKELMKWHNISRKIWEGEAIALSNKDIENVLALIENKLKDCYMKLEEY